MKPEIDEIGKILDEKMSTEGKLSIIRYTAGSIICILAKYLIKEIGYGVTSTVLTKLRDIGKRDAKKLKEIFGIQGNDPVNASITLKIMALILGLKLNSQDGNTLVIECPYGKCVAEYNEPFICNVCLEYCRGAAEELLGKEFTLKQSKRLIDGDEYCSFDIQKRF